MDRSRSSSVRVRPGIGMDRPYSSRDSAPAAAKRSGPLFVQTKEAGRDTNCARSLPKEHFSSSCALAVGSRDIKRHPRRCDAIGWDARLPPSLPRPCDITQRTTKLKLRGSDNCRHYTNHGSHTEPPTTACTASERVEWSRSLPPRCSLLLSSEEERKWEIEGSGRGRTSRR